MPIDFLRPVLGDELFAQVAEKLNGATGITLVNSADGSFVPKAKYDEDHNKVKDLTTQIADLTAQLATAQKNLGSIAELNEKVTQLSKDVADRDTRLASLSTDYEIKDALRAAKARDVDIVFGLLDRGKITKKDGKLLGADEQIQAIRNAKGFLFEGDEKQGRAGFSGQQDIIGANAGGENTNAAVNGAIRQMAGRA